MSPLPDESYPSSVILSNPFPRVFTLYLSSLPFITFSMIMPLLAALYHIGPPSPPHPPESSPSLRCAPSTRAGQPVSAKRLRPLPPSSFLPTASAATASTSQPEPQLRRGLLRGPGAPAGPATAAAAGASPASSPTPAASRLQRAAPGPAGRPANAPGPQVHRQLRRLLLGLSAVQRTELRDEPLPGLARFLGLTRLERRRAGGGGSVCANGAAFAGDE